MSNPDHERGTGKIVYTPGYLAAQSYQVVQTVYRHLEEGLFPHSWKIGKRKWIIPECCAIDYLGFDPQEDQIKVVRD